MCTYLTNLAPVDGSAMRGEEWIRVRTAVVSYDHPQEAPFEHALCIDLRSDDGDASARVSVELDAESARRLAHAILATLDDDEVLALAGTAAIAGPEPRQGR